MSSYNILLYYHYTVYGLTIYIYKLPKAWGCSKFSDPIMALYILVLPSITLKMISEHAMVLTCSYTLLFLSFINCLILSWGRLYLQWEGEREKENRFVSFKFPLTVLHGLCIYAPTRALKISNRSRYSSSTASGRQYLIIMRTNDYGRLT